jgi:hypothetical protein
MTRKESPVASKNQMVAWIPGRRKGKQARRLLPATRRMGRIVKARRKGMPPHTTRVDSRLSRATIKGRLGRLNRYHWASRSPDCRLLKPL